jgi:hypothetical protein
MAVNESVWEKMLSNIVIGWGWINEAKLGGGHDGKDPIFLLVHFHLA